MIEDWNITLSKRKKMEIELVCAKSIIEYLTLFTNQNHRGPSFTWEWLHTDILSKCDLWMMLANVYRDSTPKKTKKMINDAATYYTYHLTRKLVENNRGEKCIQECLKGDYIY